MARYGPPILIGLLIVAAGLVPWLVLSQLNLRARPDLPWAALATIVYLGAGLLLLHRRFPPRRNPPETEGVPVVAIVAALVGVYVVWALLSRAAPLPDLSAYPTTAYRWSAFLIGGITAGVVEEVGFRAYMQRGLERVDRANAIWITSLVFVVAHLTQGLGAVVLAPGLFVTSMLYGMLLRRTGSVLPGMAIHVTGDLARVYFGALHGDASLLFV